MPHVQLDGLLSVPTMDFKQNGMKYTRPITDHPPIIQNTLWGAIATINILNPGSPLAPSLQINGVKALPVNGEQQMKLMAGYIYKMFEQGVSLLALQEVPDKNSENLQFLIAELRRLNSKSHLIDVEALASQWRKTGTHSFGTSILCNPALFKITKDAVPTLNNRAATYEVTTANGKVIPIANIHGDFAKQEDTKQYFSNFNGFCLGDLNISHHAIMPASDVNNIQSVERPPQLVIDGVSCQVNTLDFIQDNFSKQTEPYFYPEVDTIIKPIVIKIASDRAISKLQYFTDYLKRTNPELLSDNRIVGVYLTTPKASKMSNIMITSHEVYQSYLKFQFDMAKDSIQGHFINELLILKRKITTYTQPNSPSYLKGINLYDNLLNAQATFFSQLTPDANVKKIHDCIADFRKVCADNVNDANRIMGHGWLYRIGEVLLKAVAGLFAGIGMMLGVVAGRGLASKEDRERFKKTFLTFSQTKESIALNEFKDWTLDCNDQIKNKDVILC